jgi:hypothetical protein
MHGVLAWWNLLDNSRLEKPHRKEIIINVCLFSLSYLYVVNAILFILYYFPMSHHVLTSWAIIMWYTLYTLNYQAAVHIHVFPIIFDKTDKIKFGKINYVLKLMQLGLVKILPYISLIGVICKLQNEIPIHF